MQDDALEEVTLEPKKRSLRMLKSEAARARRKMLKKIRETRLMNEYAKLRRERKNK